ncbi:MAG: glycosyltransferase [Candidatus Gastranaerophilales bacterium]|nr:glycosyltransferase [Candidatus Gastranaerophilales bacterium]MCM1072693.1 glycosyltransferase [Bacteroides sp.]
MKKKKVLAILPISIGGRLTTNSIIDGYRQNGCAVTVYDELFDNNLNELLKEDFSQIIGYDFSGLKIKIDNKLEIPSVNYFSDDIRSKTSGPEWEKYLPYLEDNDNYTFYWDKELTRYETFKNIHYLPHFVNFDIYKDNGQEPEFDIMFAGRLDTDYRLSFFEELVTKLPHLKYAWYAIGKHYEDARNRAKIPEIIDLCYQGFIDNEEDMARAINNAKIVFNMNSQGISSLNYRTFQTVACKRLMISDYRDELALFDGSMPFYEDFSDLIFKIESYLENKDAYNRVVEDCYNIASKSHNSKDCVRYMLKVTG